MKYKCFHYALFKYLPNPSDLSISHITLVYMGNMEVGMKISDISVDISSIHPISMMFDTISVMTDISLIYRFWTDISRKYQVCGTRAR